MSRVDLDNPVRPLVRAALNGVLDAHTGWNIRIAGIGRPPARVNFSKPSGVTASTS